MKIINIEHDATCITELRDYTSLDDALLDDEIGENISKFIDVMGIDEGEDYLITLINDSLNLVFSLSNGYYSILFQGTEVPYVHDAILNYLEAHPPVI